MRLRPNDRHTDFLASAHHGWAGLRAEGLWTKAYQKGASARRRVKPTHNVYVLLGLHPHKQTAKDAFRNGVICTTTSFAETHHGLPGQARQ
jgi:hypothetical protein